MNEIVKREEILPSTELDIFAETSVFDLARYEQVDRVASIMAAAPLIPEHLKGPTYEETKGNCFLICNLAANWKLDPFAVAQATALVFGKITLEGKLVRAVIKKHLGFDLHYAFFDEDKDGERVYVWERPFVDDVGRAMTEERILELIDLDERITPGAFAKWYTKNKQGGVNDNWAKDRRKMLRERGAREWCREFEPGLMLGVFTPDEFDDLENTSRSNRARDITPSDRNPLLDATTDKPTETTKPKPEAQPGTAARTTPPGAKGDEPKASAKPSAKADGGAGASLPSDDRPQQTPSSGSSKADDGSGGDVPIPQRVSAAIWRSYHDALARMAKAESIEKAHDNYWKDKTAGGLRITHPDDIHLGKAIKENHLLRIEGRVPADVLSKEVETWILKVTGSAA